MNIKKGDNVLIIKGKERAGHKTGRVVTAMPRKDKVVVEGANIVKRHSRNTKGQSTQTGVTERPAPIHVSNVMLICPECGKPTRVGHQIVGGKNVRVCKQPNCAAVVDRDEQRG